MVQIAQEQQIVRVIAPTLAAEHRMVDVRSARAGHVPLVAHSVGYAPPVPREYGCRYLLGHRATPGRLRPDRTPLHGEGSLLRELRLWKAILLPDLQYIALAPVSGDAIG